MIQIIVDWQDVWWIDPKRLIQVVNSWIRKSILTIEWKAKEETPVDVWVLRNAYRTRFWNLRWEIYNTAFYAKFVHDWTSPHAVSVEEIRKWATRKGLNPFMVAKWIKKRWTRSNPFMKRTMDATEPKIINIMQNELNKL